MKSEKIIIPENPPNQIKEFEKSYIPVTLQKRMDILVKNSCQKSMRVHDYMNYHYGKTHFWSKL